MKTSWESFYSSLSSSSVGGCKGTAGAGQPEERLCLVAWSLLSAQLCLRPALHRQICPSTMQLHVLQPGVCCLPSLLGPLSLADGTALAHGHFLGWETEITTKWCRSLWSQSHPIPPGVRRVKQWLRGPPCPAATLFPESLCSGGADFCLPGA